MAAGAVLVIQQFAQRYGLRIGGVRGRRRRFRQGRERRQFIRTVQRVGYDAVQGAHTGPLGDDAGFNAEGCSVAGHHCHVLFAVNLVGHGPGQHRGLGVVRPEAFAGVGGIGDELAVGGALEYQVAGRRQHAAVPGYREFHGPARLLFKGVPGQQVALEQFRYLLLDCRVFRHGGDDGVQAGVHRDLAELEFFHFLVHPGQVLGRDIDQPGVRMVGHGLPVMAAGRGRRTGELAVLITGIGRFHGTPGAHVDTQSPVHFDEGFGREQFAVGAVDDVEEAVFRRLHEHFAGFAADLQVSQQDVLGGGEVPGVAGCGLVVPGVCAGIRIHGDDGRQEQVVAAARTAHAPVPGGAVTHAQVHQIQFRIIADGVPHGAAAAEFPPFAGPGAGGLFQDGILKGQCLIAGHRVEAPYLLSGCRVVCRDVSAGVKLGAAVADQHLAVHDARRAGNGITPVAGRGLYRPDFLTTHGVQRDQPPVQCTHVNHVAPKRNTAVHYVATGIDALLRRHLWVVFPQQLAAGGIHGIDPAPGAGGVHAPVRDQWCGLQPALAGQVQVPGKFQLLDVAVIDLRQRAEPLFVVSAAVVQPVVGFGFGIHQALVGDHGSIWRSGPVTGGQKQGEYGNKKQ